MAIDMEAVRAQQRELSRVSDEVRSVKRRLKSHQDVLDDAWKSPEIRGIDSTIEDILHRLNRLAQELDELGCELMVAGLQVQEEEEIEKEKEMLRLAAESD